MPTYEAQVSRTRSVSNRKSRSQRKPKWQTDGAGALVPEVADDGADLLLLVKLLSDENVVRPLMAPDSGSVGSAHSGSLREGVQLPAHRGYVVRDPARAWGTADPIGRLTSAFDEVVRTDPVAPRVRVHDLSLQHGGPMRGHKSHQSGRDVDLTYYRRTCERECTAQPVSASELDAGRQWRLLRHWLERGHAEFIFVDYALQRPLYEQAKATGATPRQLARWFQYPSGPAFPAGVIRHVANHEDHVHVRFRCAPEDDRCLGAAATLVRERGMIAALPELAVDESADQKLFELLDDSTWTR